MLQRTLAFAGSVAAVLAFATQALAAPVPYTPTTNMPTLTAGGVTFSIGQLSNNITGATALDGFSSTAKTGTITLSLEYCATLKAFIIFNNVNTNANGVKTFTLSYLGQNGTLLGSQTVTVNNGIPAQVITVPGGGLAYVKTIRMDVTASFDARLEIREIDLEGTQGSCCP